MFSRKFALTMKIVSVILIVCMLNLIGFDLIYFTRTKNVYAEEPLLPADHQQPVELEYYSSENTEVYGNPDGTFTVEITMAPNQYVLDTLIAQDEPETSYFNEDYLSVGYDDDLGVTRSLVRWSLPDLSPFRAKILSAEIGLYLDDSPDNTPVNLHRVTGDYDPSLVTWGNQPAFAAEPESSLDTFAEGYIYFDATDLVTSWYDGSQDNYGVLFKYAATDEATAERKLFRSSDWTCPVESSSAKPKLVLQLIPEDLLGVADFWAFTPDIFRGEGSASVNLINGNLIYSVQVLDLQSRLGAFNLNLTYNSRSPYWDAWGFGWNLNAQGRIIPNSDLTVVEYINENGNRIYFTRDDSSGDYITPYGAYLTLTKTDQGYTLEDSVGTLYYFDELGRNYKVTVDDKDTVYYVFEGDSGRISEIRERYADIAEGRNIELSYNASGLLEKITDLMGTETTFEYNILEDVSRLWRINFASGHLEQKTVTFTYDESHRLINIADGNGNIGFIVYDEFNRVAEIIDPRSTGQNHISEIIDYENGTDTIYQDARGFQTLFRNNSDQNLPALNVIEVIQNYDLSSEHWLTTKYTWDKNRLIEVEDPYGRISEAAYNEDGILEYLNFADFYLQYFYDDDGNITGIETEEGEIEIEYDDDDNITSITDPSGTMGFSNSYDRFGNAIRSVIPFSEKLNLLKNADFSRASNGFPLDWHRGPSGTYRADLYSRFGTRSARITTFGASSYWQEIPAAILGEEKTFTAGGYIKTYDVRGRGASIQVFFKDDQGEYIEGGNGQPLMQETSLVIGTYDWTRFSKTFNLPEGAASVQVSLSLDGRGTAWFDGVQLLKGSTLDPFYTNDNAGMEQGTDRAADIWNLGYLQGSDGRSEEEVFAGSYAFKINSRSTPVSYGQWVDISGQKDDPVTLTGWAYLDSPSEPASFALELVLNYTDGTEGKFSIPFDGKLNEQWQPAGNTITAAKDFTRAKIFITYGHTEGAAYFDNIKLFEAPATSYYEYDEYGIFLTSETDIFGYTTSYTYDANGNTTGVTDQVGNRLGFTYDRLNRLTRAAHLAPDSQDDIAVNYTYDPQGNLIERTDPRGFVTTYDYDEINQAVKEIDPLGKYILYGFDEAGNLTSVQRGREVDNTTTVLTTEEFTYDRLNRLASKKVNGSTVFTNTYNNRGNLGKVTVAGLGDYLYDYDTNDNLTKVQEPGGFKLEHLYEGETSGLRTSYKETLGLNSWTTSFTFDTLHQLTAIHGPTDGSVPGGTVRIGDSLGLGSTEVYFDYDALGRLTSQTLLSPVQRKYFETSYYPNGKVRTYTQDYATHTYAYDFAGRLVEWDNGQDTVTYQYDKAGNLLNPGGGSPRFTFNGANEIESFDYDDAGNLQEDDKYIYTWDGEGRLTSIKDLSNNLIASYTYHPDGLRKSKTVDGVTHNYHYDGSNLIRVTKNNGDTVWAITWHGASPVMLTNAAGETFYYVTNYRGDVANILDEDGYPVASYRYDPWGLPEYASEEAAVANQPIRYASYVYDGDIGLYYLQARYYDPETARFISQDPVWGEMDSPLSQNIYGYCGGDPVNYVDPSGTIAIAIAIGGGAVITISAAALAAMLAVIIFGFVLYLRAHNRQEYDNLVRAVHQLTNEIANSFARAQKRYNYSRQRLRATVRHHIIAQTARLAAPARNIWTGRSNLNQSIHNWHNTVSLSWGFHKHLHRTSYYTMVNILVGFAYNSSGNKLFNVRDTLGRLRLILQAMDAAMPHNSSRFGFR